MNRYTELTNAEKLALDDTTFLEAVQLEAVKQGLQIPFSYEERVKHLTKVLWPKPDPNNITVFELLSRQGYRAEQTGIAFLSIEAARNALTGAICIKRDYGQNPATYTGTEHEPAFEVRALTLGVTGATKGVGQIKEEAPDLEPYEKLYAECSENLTDLRREAYRREMLKAKREKYLALAKGDLAIAKNFWASTEGSTPWDEPEAAPVITAE